MSQESNLYKAYKLAHQDRALLIKKSILAIVIIGCFGIGAILFLNLLNNFSLLNLITVTLVWLIGISLLPIAFLVFSLIDFLIINLGISIISFVPFIINGQANVFVFIIIGIIYLLFFVSRISMSSENNNLIGFNWRRIISKGSFFLLLGFVVVLSSLIYFANKVEIVEQSGEELLDKIITQTININTSSSSGDLATGTVNKMLKNYLENKLENLEEFNLAEINPEELEKNQETFLEELRSNLAEMLKIPITGQEKVSTLIIDWVKNYWEETSSLLRLGLILLGIILVLNILKFINILFTLILILFSWVLREILISIKFLTLKNIGVEKQEIIIAS